MVNERKQLNPTESCGFTWVSKKILQIYNFFIFQFRQQKMQFRPPFEEVRAKYYREMKKFMSIPLLFRGVSDDTSIYPPLIEHHASAFSVVYVKAEVLFTRLTKILDDFKDWVVLGMVDIETMVDEHLHSTSDWEKNFKALKAKGREAEKLPGYETENSQYARIR